VSRSGSISMVNDYGLARGIETGMTEHPAVGQIRRVDKKESMRGDKSGVKIAGHPEWVSGDGFKTMGRRERVTDEASRAG
jgi:hypothetical protein